MHPKSHGNYTYLISSAPAKSAGLSAEEFLPNYRKDGSELIAT
jgi:hypothetical protein